MRKIVVGVLLSLDGVAEDPNSFFRWDDAVDATAAGSRHRMRSSSAVAATTEWVSSGRAARSSRSRHLSTGSRSTSRPPRRLTEWANAHVIDGDLVDSFGI